jgi:uncharacterized protein YgiM (DUF1202 family)
MRSKRVIFLILCALLMFASSLSAQSNTLTPNTAQMAALTAESPVGLYTVSGTAGDFVQIQLVALDPDLHLSASLNNPSQQNIASSPASFGNSTSLSAYLPTSGIYTVLVGGNPGNYLIALSTVSVGDPLEIAPGVAQAAILDGASSQAFTFSTTAEATALSLATSPDTTYQASLINGSGAVIGTVNGVSACFSLPENDHYTLVLQGQDDSAGQVSLNLGNACGVSSAPGATTSSTPPQIPPAGAASIGNESVCTAYSNSNVNVRTGSGTEFNAVGTLPTGTAATVTGRTANNWLQVNFPGGAGYVFADVVTLSGPCQTIASLPNSAPTGNQGQAAPMPTAESSTQGGQSQPTSQYTATATTVVSNAPAATATITPIVIPTDIPPQSAPADGSFALNVRLDETATLSDYVSYPNGDTEDVISWRAEGLNPSVAQSGGLADFTVRFSCSGPGVENILFRIGQDTYNCNETYVRRVNADSNTGAIRVIATGGFNTYVQWTLHASLPRAN